MNLQVVAELPNKNYFSPLAAIPIRINAVWQLARSFNLWRMKGKEYREGGLMGVLRAIGLCQRYSPGNHPQQIVINQLISGLNKGLNINA